MLDLLTIALRAAFYLTALLGAGSIWVLVLLKQLPVREQQHLRRISALSGALALCFALGGVAVEAIFLAGGQWAAAFDWELIGFILDGPNGRSLSVLAAGVVLMPSVLFVHSAGHIFALLGAMGVAASFGLTGHTWAAAGWLLNGLVVLHVLLLSFWVGIFYPLFRVAGRDSAAAAAVAEAFGRLAIWAVPVLALAGLVTLHRLTGGLLESLSTPYGQIVAIKLGLFAGVLAFAAYNRLVITPALARGEAGAAQHLRRSLILEALLILGVLLVTATVTTQTGP